MQSSDSDPLLLQTDVVKTESLIKELDERRGSNSTEIEALLRECEGVLPCVRPYYVEAHWLRIAIGAFWRVALRASEEELGHRMEADYWQKQHNTDLILKGQRMAKRYESYDAGRAADEETVRPPPMLNVYSWISRKQCAVGPRLVPRGAEGRRGEDLARQTARTVPKSATGSRTHQEDLFVSI